MHLYLSPCFFGPKELEAKSMITTFPSNDPKWSHEKAEQNGHCLPSVYSYDVVHSCKRVQIQNHDENGIKLHNLKITE